MSSSGTHERHVATCDWVEIQGVIHGGHLECDMWQVRGQVLLTHLDQIGGEKRRRGREERKPRKEREKRRDFRVRSPYFSLSFPAIGLTVSGGARGRVHLHDKGFA